MIFQRFGIVQLATFIIVFNASAAQALLEPFRDAALGRWGYKRADGSVAIAPHYAGAGQFSGGHAPVEDGEGFAIIDEKGTIVDRIPRNSVAASAEPVPPPSGECVWSGLKRFPSAGLDCYIRQVRGSARAAGGEIARRPVRGEGFTSAVVLRLRFGVVVIEEIAYEGFKRRVILPGVGADRALQWRRMLYPDMPAKEGCSESWTTGAIQGGSFIEQAVGC